MDGHCAWSVIKRQVDSDENEKEILSKEMFPFVKLEITVE